MKDALTGKTLKKTKTQGTDWAALRRMGDAEIHAAVVADPDVTPTDEAFWEKAQLVMPRPKQTVTMRLDEDLLSWFRQQSGYQTRINAILRAYMDAKKSPELRPDR